MFALGSRISVLIAHMSLILLQGVPPVMGGEERSHPRSGAQTPMPISPLGIIFFKMFCSYKTQEDIENIVFIEVLRGVR